MEGNQMKMREALEFVHDKLLTWNYTDKATAKMAVAIVDRCSKALSAPARQCDVGTAEEQTTRFRKFCSAHKYIGSDSSYMCKGFGKGRCPFFNSHTKSQCEFAWAQMPYEAAAERYADKRVVAYEPVSNKAAWIALARIGNAIQLKMKECPLAVTTHEYAIMNLCYRTFADHPNHGTPPRNCDIYPKRDDAGEAWNKTLDERTRDMVQHYPLTAMDMFIDWLLAYAEDGGVS